MPILKRSSLVEVNMTIHRLSEIEITRWSSYAAVSGWSERLGQLSKLGLRSANHSSLNLATEHLQEHVVRMEILLHTRCRALRLTTYSNIRA
jgi:hypothetical protein